MEIPDGMRQSRDLYTPVLCDSVECHIAWIGGVSSGEGAGADLVYHWGHCGHLSL
jgi:hypothetical protein